MNGNMDLYKDMTLSGGPCGATTYNPSPLLALHDFIGQQAATISSYAYSMSVLREEDEEEDHERPSLHNELPPLQDHTEVDSHNTYQEGRPEEEPIPPNHQGEDEAQPNAGRPTPDATIRPQPTHWETAPQTTTKRPNWQTIRFQSLPGKHGDKTQLEAWIGGWAAAVGELGDETYCACADSTVAAPPAGEEEWCSSITSEKGKRKKERLGEGRGSDDTRTDRGRRREEEEEEEQIPRLVSFALCCTCSRLPSPAIVPDQEFSFGPTSGAGKVAQRCKVVWRSVVGRLARRQQQPRDVVGHGGREGPGIQNCTATQRDYGYDEEEDDDEVDIDKLSRSSGEGGDIRRAGDAIAEKQARLRRAQRLLRKGSRGFSEPG